jgi:RNA polymerase sigma-70 factor (ECF subfamily)
MHAARVDAMKIFEDEVLPNISISDGHAAPDQRCTAESDQPGSPGKVLEQNPAASAEQIEREVNELLQKYITALTRYATSLSHDSATVQDGIQEAFLRYFMARVRGQQIDNPRAWLFRVLRNYLLDCNRKYNSMQTVDLKKAAHVADLHLDVEAGYQQSEAFRRALATLSPRELECMQLRLDGFDYSEIAQIMQIRLGTVGALLARGLKKFKNAGSEPRKP